MDILSPRRRRALWNWWRSYRAWLTVFVLAVLLGATGLAGAGRQHPLRGERFDAKQITITPSGNFGVRVREVVDIDFGRHDRHGYFREIPNDLGVPTGVRASSPTANADVTVTPSRHTTDVRIGSAAETFSGQHRYVVEYTYPAALVGDSADRDNGLAPGELALDVIGTEDALDTAMLEIVLAGFELNSPVCDRGRRYDIGRCTLTRQHDGTYRAVLTDLEAGEGVSLFGRVDGRTGPVDVALPELPDRPPTFPRPMGAVLGAAAVAPVLALWLFARWFGTNRVAQGGPTEAAFPTVPLPPPGAPHNDLPTYRVPDSRLDELATVEFAPPAGLRAWQGVLAVDEHIGAGSVTAWFSDMIAAEALVVKSAGEGYVRFARGPREELQSDEDRRIIRTLFGDRTEASLAAHDPRAVEAWRAVERMQERFARESGWWRRHPPTAADRNEPVRINPYWVSIVLVHVVIVGAILLRGQFFRAVGALLRLPFLIVAPPAVAIAATAVAAGAAYIGVSKRRWPARSATGSAAALRTMSFQKFLDRSEGAHVEWAWQQRKLREYSAWAVALGASDAWGRAIEATDLAPRVEFVGAVADVARAFDGFHVDFARPRRREYDNPWPRYFEALAKNAGSGGSSSRSGGGSGGGSRGVGRGGGGGRSGSW